MNIPFPSKTFIPINNDKWLYVFQIEPFFVIYKYVFFANN